MQVEKLIDDGYDVRGYYYWTLLDNFEVRALGQLCPGNLSLDQQAFCTTQGGTNSTSGQ